MEEIGAMDKWECKWAMCMGKKCRASGKQIAEPYILSVNEDLEKSGRANRTSSGNQMGNKLERRGGSNGDKREDKRRWEINAK